MDLQMSEMSTQYENGKVVSAKAVLKNVSVLGDSDYFNATTKIEGGNIGDMSPKDIEKEARVLVAISTGAEAVKEAYERLTAVETAETSELESESESVAPDSTSESETAE
jgi:hypothetical protein